MLPFSWFLETNNIRFGQETLASTKYCSKCSDWTLWIDHFSLAFRSFTAPTEDTGVKFPYIPLSKVRLSSAASDALSRASLFYGNPLPQKFPCLRNYLPIKVCVILTLLIWYWHFNFPQNFNYSKPGFLKLGKLKICVFSSLYFQVVKLEKYCLKWLEFQ